MLELTAISTVLVPYFKPPAAASRSAAAALARRIEQALTADPTASAVWVPFKQNPEALEAAMVSILKDKIGKDTGLAADLEKLTAPAVKEQTPRRASSMWSRGYGSSRAPLWAPRFGTEVVNGIYAKVKQVVDTVESGGCLTGMKIGKK